MTYQLLNNIESLTILITIAYLKIAPLFTFLQNTMSNSKMIVVSNRLPFVLKRESENGDLSRKSSAGGLVTAVAPVVVQCDGKYS